MKTEEMIQQKGATSAPRVTPMQIEQTIAAEYYTTADKAFGDAPILEPLKLLTICTLVLRNGFAVVGTSACASPENFDAEIGRHIARSKAVEKIWELEGYLLKEQLFQRTQPAQIPE